ncbi:MAG TPA: hypothetical protein VFW83_09275 [Bryobacteraceae bacterium]|nr:hypothetical protein [Bryobacteraceae bacterium]
MLLICFLAFAATLLLSCSAPVDASGRWSGEFYTQIGPQQYSFQLRSSGRRLTGTITSPRGTTELTDGKISGDRIAFVEMTNDNEGRELRVDYRGQIHGIEMKLKRTPGAYLESEAVVSRTK